MQLSFQLSLQVCSLYFSCNIAASIEGNNERFLFSKTQKRELALLLHLKSPPSFQICHFCIKKKLPMELETTCDRSLSSVSLFARAQLNPQQSVYNGQTWLAGFDMQSSFCNERSAPATMEPFTSVRGEEASVGTRQKPLQLRRGCFFSAAVCTQSCRGLIQRGQKVKLSIALIPSQAYYETECADTTCAIF